MTPALGRRWDDVVRDVVDTLLRRPGGREIADASGLSPRGLQAAFLRHRDTTPTAYARRVRMEGAHRDPAAADPADRDTLRSIPARWGFDDGPRFAADHERACGRPPGQTVRG